MILVLRILHAAVDFVAVGICSPVIDRSGINRRPNAGEYGKREWPWRIFISSA
jgi:hypothetical protein